MYKLNFTKGFEKSLKKLSSNEQKAVAQKLKLLIQNPFYPSLRTKKIQGFNWCFIRNADEWSCLLHIKLYFTDFFHRLVYILLYFEVNANILSKVYNELAEYIFKNFFIFYSPHSSAC